MAGSVIHRRVEQATDERFDLVVIGGGIHGVALVLEASRQGLRTLLIERADFGAETTWNSLRIVHGGLRYLQSFDLPRFYESVSERAWLLGTFPGLVEPLGCLMPLYGDGLRRSSILATALGLNDWLSRRRNVGLSESQSIPKAELWSRSRVEREFPEVSRTGLQSGAVWYDAIVPDSQRLVIEMLRWAAAHGATLLNYMDFQELETTSGRASAIRVLDRVSGRVVRFSSPVVVNCGGPWTPALAATCGAALPRLYHPSIALNLILDRSPLADMALAIAPRAKGARTYFLVPWKGRIHAGTFHAPWTVPTLPAEVPGDLVEAMLADLNRALPGARFRREEVLRVTWGILPVTRPGTIDLATRDTFWSHGRHGGVSGVFSVTGVKLTTARAVAERALSRISRELGLKLDPPAPEPPVLRPSVPSATQFHGLLTSDPNGARQVAEDLIGDEAVVMLEDLLLRRTDWGMFPADEASTRGRLVELLSWHEPPVVPLA